MAQFQYRDGRPVPTAIDTVVGSVLPLKLIPAAGESLPIDIITSNQGVFGFTEYNVRKAQNFTSFSIRAVSTGRATLSANATTRTVAVTVLARLSLPPEDTREGLYARVFLAEVRGPADNSYVEADIDDAMIMMRSVIDNRLRNPSYLYASDGARSVFDVIRRPGQFRGFGSYPSIEAAALQTINGVLALANDGADRRSIAARRFVLTALNIAGRSGVLDPSGTGLYFWRTQGKGAPSPRVELYRSVLGNSFYRLIR